MQNGYSLHSFQVGHRTTVGSVALALMLLAAVVLLPITEGRAATEEQITFEGGGFGHSVGLSQFGAYGMALEGATWEEIVTHYFTGTTVGDLDPAIAAEPIWVGLQQERSRFRLTVFRTWAGDAVPVVFSLGDATVSAVAGETVTITDLGGGSCRVEAPSGTLEGPCRVDAVWDGWDAVPSVGLQVEGCSLPDWNAEGGVVYRPCQYARGDLHVRPDNSAGLNLSVEIDIEDYLLGISEMPYFWGEVGGAAALEAQVVAARSYALHRAIVRGDAEDRPWCACDIYDTTVDQFYAGWGHGQTSWIDAVRATAGKVIYHPSSTWGGVQIPIEAFYSSSTFGTTENSEHGFTAAIPYLRSVDDHWAILPEVGNRHGRWTKDYTGAELATLLPGIESVTDAEITACSATGAALEITFSGEYGSKAFATRDLRRLLGLRSMQVINVGAPPSEEPPCSGPGLSPLPDGGPLVLTGFSIDDDEVEDSAGNGDGIASCGEDIEVFTTFHNQGESLIDLEASVSEVDPYLEILWNTSSDMDDLAGDTSGTHRGDWDFRLSPDAPDGYAAEFSVLVESGNGGPWSFDVQIPVSCPAPQPDPIEEPAAEPTTTTTTIPAPPAPTTTTTTVPVDPEPIVDTPAETTDLTAGTAMTQIPDVDGDGQPDTAVVAKGSDQRSHLIITAGGSVQLDIALKGRTFTPSDVVEIGNVGGSPAADVAVLLVRESKNSFFVVVDTATGEVVTERALHHRYHWIDVEVLQRGEEAGITSLAFLAANPGTANRIFVFDAQKGIRVESFRLARRMTPLDLEVLPDYLGGERSELAVLGKHDNGRVDIQVVDGSRIGGDRLTAGRGIDPIDIETLPGSPPGLAMLVAGPAGPELHTMAMADGRIGPALDLPLASATEAEAIESFGGGPNVVAVLGTADDGSATVTVIDAATGAVLAGPLFPDAPADLEPVAGTADLAVLRNGADGVVYVTIARAASGELRADQALDAPSS